MHRYNKLPEKLTYKERAVLNKIPKSFIEDDHHKSIHTDSSDEITEDDLEVGRKKSGKSIHVVNEYVPNKNDPQLFRNLNSVKHIGKQAVDDKIVQIIRKPGCLFYEKKKKNQINLKFHTNEFFKYCSTYLLTMGNVYFYVKKQTNIALRFYRKAANIASNFEDQGSHKY